ncbi:salt tolerance down-regulator-domain-containing protein [Lentinula detonsa]|uniref:Stress response protein NST1 n=1 Tax=Lentinula detonsa TaxID=2804962 RepID=A0A9W8NPY0_9AGAR|nr:salt tolerance down-regulator-domain-containing protein [Lentinula detonsa]
MPASRNTPAPATQTTQQPSQVSIGKKPMTYNQTQQAQQQAQHQHGQPGQTGQPRSARAASKAPMNPNQKQAYTNHHPSGGNSNTSSTNSKGRPPGTSSTANGTKDAVANKSKIWSTSINEERERIKEFWLGLGEEERRNLVKIEKDMVLRKMKEQQKHSCSCAVCGRKRNAIEEELEVLYDAYYDELEQYANYQQRYVSSGGTIPPPPGPGPFPGSVELDKNGAVIGHPGHPQHVAGRNHRPNVNAKVGRGGKDNIAINGRGKQVKHPPPESEFDDADDDPNADPDADLDEDEYEEEDEDGDDYEDDEEEDEDEDPDPDPDEEDLSPNPNLPVRPGVNGVGGGRGRGALVRATAPQSGVDAGEGRGRGRGAESPLNATKNQGRNGLFNLGSSLTVTGPGNILTVADDLLDNNGQKFIEMMEQLAERRMQREEEAVGDLEDDSEDDEDEDDEDGGEDESNLGSEDDDEDLDRRRRRRRQRDVEDEGSEDEDEEDEEEEDEDEDDEEEEVMTEEQKMEEGKRMFSVFAARMFERRVWTAYREKVAQMLQSQLLRELEDEDKIKKEREAKKQDANQKKKDKKRQQKLAKEEGKARRDAEKLASENALKAQQAALEEEQRKKREEERVKREALRKAQELEKAKKDEEKRKRKDEERRKRMEVEKEREKERERKRKEAKEREAREAKEAKERAAAVALEKEKKDREERERKEKEEKERKAKEEKEKAAERERMEKERERKEKEAREKKEKEDREREAREKKVAAAAAVNPRRSISGSGPQSPRASGSGSTSPPRAALNGISKKTANAAGKPSPVILSVSAPSASTLIPAAFSAPVSIPVRTPHPPHHGQLGQTQFQQQPVVGGSQQNHLSQPRPLVAHIPSSMSSGPSTPITPLHHMHMGPPQTPMFGQPPNMGLPHQATGISPRMQHGPFSPSPFGSFAPMQQQPQQPPHSGPAGPPPGHSLAPSALPRGFTGSHPNGPSPFDPTAFNRGMPGAPPPAPIGPPPKLNTLPTSASVSSALAPGSSPIQANTPRRMSVNYPDSGLGPITRPAPIGPPAPIGSGAPIMPIAPIARPSAINSSSTSTLENANNINHAGPSHSLPSSGSGSPVRNSPRPRRSSSPKGVLGSSALAADDDEVVPVNKGRRPGNMNVGQGWGPASPSRGASVIGSGAIGGDRGPWGPPPPGVGMSIHNPHVSPIGGFGVGAPRSAGLWGPGLVQGASEWHPYQNSFMGQAQAPLHTGASNATPPPQSGN